MSLATLTPDDLWNSEIILALGCGRAKGTFRKQRRQVYCLIGQQIQLEIDLRGLPHPPKPYHFGDMKHPKDAL